MRRPNPMHPLGQLRDEVDRVFSEFVRGLPALSPGNLLPTRPYPAVNVWETDLAFFAEAELPGISEGDIEILVVGNELTIKGERQETPEDESATYHRRERGTGAFSRVVRLPATVHSERVQASLENGVLTIVLPKSEAARARKIVVQPASAPPAE